MNTKMIALTTSALVAVAAFATTASAAGAYMGKVNLGVGYAWEQYDSGSAPFDRDASFLNGGASVNVPYNETVSLQLDVFGAGSLDNIGTTGNDSYYGGFGGGAHINYRDQQGQLGVFMAVARADTGTGSSSGDNVVFAAGFEGQWYCNMWTLSAQVGYLDSDTNGSLVSNAGLVNIGADYYASSKLKLSAGLGYLDGESPDGSANDSTEPTNNDVKNWNWSLGIEYMFGKTIPVSTYLEYRGQRSEEKYPFDPSEKIDRDAVNVGVRFYFGGDGDLMKADRDGASMKSPDLLTLPRYEF